MAIVILLLTAVGVTLGLPTNNVNVKADPTPCKTQEEWEGRCSEWDHVTEFNNRFFITFDAKNQRKRLMEEKRSYMPGHRYVEYLKFYKEKVEYQIDHTYNTCTKLPLGTFRNHTIPKDAILEDEYELGPPGHSILAQEWSDRVTGREKEEWIGVFTTAKEGCWPMFEIFTKDEGNKSISFSTRFFNLSAGIKDRSVFDIPDICKKTNFAGMPPKELPAFEPKQIPAFSDAKIDAKMNAPARIPKREGLSNDFSKKDGRFNDQQGHFQNPMKKY